MTFATIRIERDPRGIATLILSRPKKHNAIDAEMIGDLTAAAATLGADAGIRAVILRGDGPSFCAGGDLTWMQSQFAATRADRIAHARRLADMLQALNELPKPLIGAAHGSAFGGGVGLLSVCDYAVATAGTRFGLTETRLGLVPATIGPYVAARLGEGAARRVFMSSRTFTADEALSLGLLAAVVRDDGLAAAAEHEATAYLATAPGAVAAAKRLLRRLGHRIDAAIIDATIEMLADIWETAEAHEGVAAFLARRKPNWTVEPSDLHPHPGSGPIGRPKT